MKPKTFILQPQPGYSPEIGLFLASLESSRKEWREDVKDLDREELAKKILPGIQPIGTIIIHIAEVEYFWIEQVISGKEMTGEIKRLLHHDLWFKDFAAEGLDIKYCLEVIERIHDMARNTLAGFSDSDMDRLFTRQHETHETHHSLRWILAGLLDHEANHKGQILMLKRLIREEKA